MKKEKFGNEITGAGDSEHEQTRFAERRKPSVLKRIASSIAESLVDLGKDRENFDDDD